MLPFLLVVLLAGGPGPEAPPLPAVDLAALPPDARHSIASALDAARAAPHDADAVGRLGIVLHAWEMWEPALAAYARAEALDPDESRWPHLAGLLQSARGLHAEAAVHFARALELQPDSAALQLRLGEARLDAGEPDEAVRQFAPLVHRPETAPAAEYGLGRVAAASGRYKEAAEHFRRALAGFPDFGAAHYGLAQALRRLGRIDEARDAIERHRRCPACWPETADPVRALVDNVREDAVAALARAIARAHEGDLDGAVAAHLALVERWPGMAQAHVNLIGLLGRQQRWAEAEAHYRLALEGGANAADAHANFGEVLLAQGRHEEAAAAFERALQVSPHFGAAANGRGMALEALGDEAGALDAYRKAVAAAPTLRLARFNLGRLLAKERRFAEAIAAFEHIQRPEDAETPRYRFALAAALVASGDRQRGREVAIEALALARRFGQESLAANIERQLAELPAP